MSQQIPKVTKSLQRLLALFNQIEDEDIREIIADVVMIESKYRSSSRMNFPINDVRNVVDRIARVQERSDGLEGKL